MLLRTWSTRGYEPKVTAMRQARTALEQASADRTRDFVSLRAELDTFVATLDACLYLEADQFTDLLGTRQALRHGIESLAPKDLAKDAKDFLVLHAAGVAYAQKGDWKVAAKTLNKVALADGVPHYVPAGSVWLTSQYHAYVAELESDHPEVELDSTQFFAKVQEFMVQARLFLDALRQVQWNDTARPSGRGYFVRELLKDLGSIGSILAEYASPAALQADLFQQAEADLGACLVPIDGAAHSALDHNNLADLYRQMADVAKQNEQPAGVQDAYYAHAHDQLDKAFGLDGSDPTFCHTRAMVFFSQRRCDKGLRALEDYTKSQAEKARGRDIEQYVDNQILAAKLLAAIGQDGEPPDLTRIVWVLDGAKEFLNRYRVKLGDHTADNLQARIEELLGYAYLQWPRRESSALEAFDRLFKLPQWKPMDVTKVRCCLWRARALIRVARTRRREYSRELAGRLRERARTDLIALVTLLGAFKADSTVPRRRRERNARLRLDTVISLQALAEEYFAGEELERAKGLLNQEADILTSLANLNLPDQTGAQMRDQVGRSSSRLALLSGRILIRVEPHTVDLIGKVEEKFNEARGFGAEQDCQIDLELGELLLRSARLRLGTPMHLYDRAVESFERAASHNAPALRNDTIRALSVAYAMRETVMRVAKANSGATQSKGAK